MQHHQQQPPLPKSFPFVTTTLTLFVVILIPVYAFNYGLTNFLYLCDVALLWTWYGLVTEDSLIVSSAFVGILLPQTVWVLDFLLQLVGLQLNGIATYMFDPSLSLFLRFLSSFQFFLPFVLLYGVWALGYDEKAFLTWCAMSTITLILSYCFSARPPAVDANTPTNINYVFGLRADQPPQTLVWEIVWVMILIVMYPILFYFPTHLFSRVFLPKRRVVAFSLIRP